MGYDSVLPFRPSQPAALTKRLPHESTDDYADRIVEYIGQQRAAIDRMFYLIVRSISEHHGAGDLAERPLPGIKNRTYLVMDAAPKLLSIDDGTAWHDIVLP